MKRLICGSLAALAVFYCGCVATPAPAADPLTAAQQRLARDPGDVRNLIQLAELYFQAGDYLRAHQYLALVAQLGGSGPQPGPGPGSGPGSGSGSGVDEERLFHLAVRISVKGKQYTDAIRLCQQRLERAADDARVRRLLSNLLEAIGDDLAAERQWRLLLALHPKQLHYLIELAQFYERSLRADRKRLAQELYLRYLALEPEGRWSAQVKAALVVQQSDESWGQK